MKRTGRPKTHELDPHSLHSPGGVPDRVLASSLWRFSVDDWGTTGSAPGDHGLCGANREYSSSGTVSRTWRYLARLPVSKPARTQRAATLRRGIWGSSGPRTHSQGRGICAVHVRIDRQRFNSAIDPGSFAECGSFATPGVGHPVAVARNEPGRCGCNTTVVRRFRVAPPYLCPRSVNDEQFQAGP